MASVGPDVSDDDNSIWLDSCEETERLGYWVSKFFSVGDLLCLRGDLGSGKTTVARGFVRCLLEDNIVEVSSPTYLICNSYEKRNGANLVKVHHIDPFRLAKGKIMALMDLGEMLESSICVIEWPERVGDDFLSKHSANRMELIFEGTGPRGCGRRVCVRGFGEKFEQLSWSADAFRKYLLLNEAATISDATCVFSSEGARVPLLGGERNSRQFQSLAKALPEDVRSWVILGIESSCDDTGAAVVMGDGKILGECLASQSGEHDKFGGVKPDIARACHERNIHSTVAEALRISGLDARQLNGVAVTVGPGLGLCLQVGVRKALSICSEFSLPYIRIHHMEAHAMVASLPSATSEESSSALPVGVPTIVLLVSGGHNLLLLSRAVGNHCILGSALDDSVGEAFDKTARILGIEEIPGGPLLEKLALGGDSTRFAFTLPFKKSKHSQAREGCDFSFSGLKTQVKDMADLIVSETDKKDLAASFQAAAIAHLIQRTARAISWVKAQVPTVKYLVAAGGVASNLSLRTQLGKLALKENLLLVAPPPRLCVDNGVMVAWLGHLRLRLGLYDQPPMMIKGKTETTTNNTTGASVGDSIDKAVEVLPRWLIGPKDKRSIDKPSGVTKQKKRPRIAGGCEIAVGKNGDLDRNKRKC